MVTSDSALRLGVDLGGTKTEAVVLRVGPDEPEIVARLRRATPREGGYEAIVAGTGELIGEVAVLAGLRTLPPIGVGMPGSVTMKRADGSRSDVPLVKNSNTTCLNGRPFRADLVRALEGVGRESVGHGAGPGGLPVAFANDANCFALAEARYGAVRGARVAFGVILGTGVGGGVVLAHGDGADDVQAWDGLHGIAGEWGHVVLDAVGGLPCYCGRRGCIETVLSGPALEAAYAARSGARLSLAAIAAARDVDVHARAVIGEMIENFGRAVATLIDILDPDAIVLGGGVSNLDVLYEEGPASVARWVFNDELRTPIVKNALGDSAGVLGAALLPGPPRPVGQ
ncbi:MAG TPA: ROK family protein [Polyangiaceae bacterium]|nr:ROK family protein [Polyangiaceae bacterium]